MVKKLDKDNEKMMQKSSIHVTQAREGDRMK